MAKELSFETENAKYTVYGFMHVSIVLKNKRFRKKVLTKIEEHDLIIWEVFRDSYDVQSANLVMLLNISTRIDKKEEDFHKFLINKTLEQKKYSGIVDIVGAWKDKDKISTLNYYHVLKDSRELILPAVSDYRNLIWAAKMEKIIAPKLKKVLKRKPRIFVLCGANHANPLKNYLLNKKKREKLFKVTKAPILEHVKLAPGLAILVTPEGKIKTYGMSGRNLNLKYIEFALKESNIIAKIAKEKYKIEKKKVMELVKFLIQKLQ